jgi:protein SCO1/2
MAHRTRRLILLGTLAPLLAACERAGPASASFKSIDITGADYARELDLADADGRRRSLAEFKGKVVIVFFGFTQCPDVCPTTLAEVAAVRKALGKPGEKVQPIFISVDPERDTPEVLRAYAANFGSDVIALRGSAEETQRTAKHFKVFYSKVPGKAEGSYSVDHTAVSYIFDKQGRVRLVSRYGAGAEALQHDLAILLAEAG